MYTLDISKVHVYIHFRSVISALEETYITVIRRGYIVWELGVRLAFLKRCHGKPQVHV